MAYSKSEKTKQFIIERVAPIFNKKGYAGTSLSDLTEATGLTKGSIYGNFKNKDEVAIEACKYNLSLVVQSLMTGTDGSNTTPFDKLLALAKNYLKAYGQLMSMGGCPILNTASDADDTHPTLKKMVQDTVVGLKNFMISLIKESIEQEQIKADTNPEKTANVVIALAEGGFLISKLFNDKRYFKNSIEQVEEIIMGLKL